MQNMTSLIFIAKIEDISLLLFQHFQDVRILHKKIATLPF